MIVDSVVRLGVPGDEPAIMALLRQMHSEIGVFSYSEERTRETLQSILNAKTRPLPMPGVVGVIGPVTDLQATIGLMMGRVYYTEEWHLGDLWTFVREDCRRSNHAKELIDFAKRMAACFKVKSIGGVFCDKQTEQKMRLYRRRYGPLKGGYFMYDPLAGVP